MIPAKRTIAKASEAVRKPRGPGNRSVQIKRCSTVAEEYMNRRDGHTLANLTSCIRLDRRDLLSDIIAWCHQHPDAPAQSVIWMVHEKLKWGEL